MNNLIFFDEFNLYILRRGILTSIFSITSTLLFLTSGIMGIKDIQNKDTGTTATLFGLSAEQVVLVASTVGTLSAYILKQTASINFEEKLIELPIVHPEFSTIFLNNFRTITSANFMVSLLFLVNTYLAYEQNHPNIFLV